jgi:hypothetical protein
MGHHYQEGTEDLGFKVNDRRGREPDVEPCRVCGAPGDPQPHTREYNKPTMKCIEYLRNQARGK